MNRACELLGLAVLSSVAAHGQSFATGNPVAQAPQTMTARQRAVAESSPEPRARSVEMKQNGQCQSVRAGDIVHYKLRVEGVSEARFILSDLSMGLGSHPHYVKTDFLLSTHMSFGGGGAGVRDASDPQLYDFHFQVPNVRSGIYHTAAIGVRAGFRDNSTDPGTGVDLNKHARTQVQHYCLAVFGGEGGAGGERMLVTEFLPGAIEAGQADGPLPAPRTGDSRPSSRTEIPLPH